MCLTSETALVATRATRKAAGETREQERVVRPAEHITEENQYAWIPLGNLIQGHHFQTSILINY